MWLCPLTSLDHRIGGCVPGQGSEHLPSVLPHQPGSQAQDPLQLPARHDVRRYREHTRYVMMGLDVRLVNTVWKDL